MQANLLYPWGNDLEVVNNARVSFDNESNTTLRCDTCGVDLQDKENGVCPNYPMQEDPRFSCMMNFKPDLKDGDKRLIQYLARGVSSKEWNALVHEVMKMDEPYHKRDIAKALSHWRNTPTHWAPFANGVGAKFHIKAPIPIMRQVFKSKIGSVESEVSRRYVKSEPEVFRPEFRKAAENVKQGSSDVTFEPEGMDVLFEGYNPVGEFQELSDVMTVDEFTQLCIDFYHHLLDQGVCPEQARLYLPQGAMTEARVSNSLYGWARFCIQRQDPHAQKEIRDLAADIDTAMNETFPVSWQALVNQAELPLN